jgi:hypothetical protein
LRLLWRKANASLRSVTKYPPRSPTAPAVWICLCAFCSCVGWVLSAFHQLNATGYTVTFVAGLAAVWVLRKRICEGNSRGRSLRKQRQRFRRLFPLAFLILAVMAIWGGAVYAPSNYDGLAYRTPRVLHWLAEGRWHWIHTEFTRLNTRATGFEWLCAPVIALTKTDRPLFLINAISLLLMPGLVFSLFTRLGVRGRVAWHWMWLAPTGYCYLLQAGSIGNDLFCSVLALAAMDCALRAQAAQRMGDVWLAILAAGVMTGSKLTMVVLLLPWLAALAPALKVLRRNAAATVGVLLVTALASFLPSAALNAKHCGDWSGLVAEGADFPKATMALRLANNSVLLTIQNLAPPVFPFSTAWNRAMERLRPAAWRARLEESFEPVGARWHLGEMQSEEAAGLGFGVTALLLVSLIGSLAMWSGTSGMANGAAPGTFYTRAVMACAWISLLTLMAKSSLSGVGRLAAPYYILCIPALLMCRGQVRLVRTRWWRGVALVVFGVAGLLVVLSPARPLWPANKVLANVAARGQPLLARARVVYGVQGQRADAFGPARKLLPPDLKVLGLITSDDPETSLWRPFGRRRIEHVTPRDTAEDLRRRGIRYVLLSSERFEPVFRRSLEQWLAEMHAARAGQVTLQLRATIDPSDWLLVRLGTDGQN